MQSGNAMSSPAFYVMAEQLNWKVELHVRIRDKSICCLMVFVQLLSATGSRMEGNWMGHPRPQKANYLR